LVDFQVPESTDQQINRFGLFASLQELSICQSVDLFSTMSENQSSISIFVFCTIFWERDGSKLSSIGCLQFMQICAQTVSDVLFPALKLSNLFLIKWRESLCEILHQAYWLSMIVQFGGL
jgi:hypothetical protein